jgi:hypothetical protein
MDETTDASQNDAARFVQRQAINRSGCYMLLFFFSLLFLNFEEDTAARAGRLTVQDQIDAIKYEKSLLTNVTFGQNISHVCILESITGLVVLCLSLWGNRVLEMSPSTN